MPLYYSHEVKGSTPVYLTTSEFHEPGDELTPGQIDAASRFLFQRGGVLLSDSSRILKGSTLSGLCQVGLSAGVNVKELLSVVGVTALVSPDSGRIEPIGCSEYDARGSVQLTEFAERSDWTQVWRVDLMDTAIAGMHQAPAPKSKIRRLKKPMQPKPEMEVGSAQKVKVGDGGVDEDEDTVHPGAPQQPHATNSPISPADSGGALATSPTDRVPGTHARLSESHDSTLSTRPSSDTALQTSSPTRDGGITHSDAIDTSLPAKIVNIQIDQPHPEHGHRAYHGLDDHQSLLSMAKQYRPVLDGIIRKVVGHIPDIDAFGKEIDPGFTSVMSLQDMQASGRPGSAIPGVLSAILPSKFSNDGRDIEQMLGALPSMTRDFTTEPKLGMRARVVQVPMNGAFTAQVSIVPSDMVDAHAAALKAFSKFQSPEVPLHEFLEVLAKHEPALKHAWGAHSHREMSPDVRAGDDLQAQSYMDVQNPIDGDKKLARDVEGALDSATPNWRSMLSTTRPTNREAYMAAVASTGLELSEGAARVAESLRAICDGISYTVAGETRLLPLGPDQIYTATTAKLSEYAKSRHMAPVPRRYVN